MDISVLVIIVATVLVFWFAVDYYKTIRRDKNPRKESDQKNNYPVLKVISRIYNFLALLMVLASIISFVILLINMDDYGSNIVMLMIGSILSGVIGYIILNGISEVIILFVDIANDVSELKDKHLGKI